MQGSAHVFMIRPLSFRMNEETASNNHYQRTLKDLDSTQIIEKARYEFDALVRVLLDAGVHVEVFEESMDHDTPDALFPNNWISTHADGTVALYPMFAPNRRVERREDILHDLEHVHEFSILDVLDFTEFEDHDRFLEGTGSLVLDRVHGKAYAALSLRTDRGALGHLCSALDIEGIAFTANQTVDGQRTPIYHTNVMMSVGTEFAAVCLDAIDDPEERDIVVASLKEDGLTIVELSEAQIEQFAGNMLELNGTSGRVIVMSSAAFNSLTDDQRTALSSFGTLIHSDLKTIEACGGGSARCMIAEIHLPLSPEQKRS